MVGIREYEEIEKIIEDIGRAANINEEETREKAKHLYEELGLSGGCITSLDIPPSLEFKTPDELADIDSQFKCKYGIDSSVAQPISLTSGEIISFAVARTGATGEADYSLSDKSTIIVVVYDENENIEGIQTGEVLREDNLSIEIIKTDTLPRRGKLKEKTAVKDLCRVISEGKHFRELSEQIDQGIVFLDGSIYPRSMASKLLFLRQKGETHRGAQLAKRSINNYVEAIQNLHGVTNNVPVVGVVKSMAPTSLVDAVVEKTEEDIDSIQWPSDSLFMEELLNKPGDHKISHTSWFREDYMERENEKFTIEELVETDSIIDLERTFLYTRLSAKNLLFRIETPYEFVSSKEDQRLISDKIISEIGMEGDTPEPIKIADSEANLSRDQQKQIKQKIARVKYDYNKDYRGAKYLGQEGDNT